MGGSPLRKYYSDFTPESTTDEAGNQVYSWKFRLPDAGFPYRLSFQYQITGQDNFQD